MLSRLVRSVVAIAGIVLIVGPVGPTAAQAPVLVSDHVPNRATGYCCWTSLQMLALAMAREHPRDVPLRKLCDLANIRAARGPSLEYVLTDAGWTPRLRDPGPAQPHDVSAQLDALGAKYRTTPKGPLDHEFLRKACRDRLGAMVEVRGYPAGLTGTHALAVLDYRAAEEEFTAVDGTKFRDQVVEFMDTNTPGVVYRTSRGWLESHWTGWAVVLERPAEAAPRPRSVVAEAIP